MGKIIFQDLPSLNTELNAYNLNNNFKYCLPIGGIVQYAGSTAPDGYLICDGSAISRTTYADLFNVIGTYYGTGDGSTTFNLPNLKGRIPVGYDNSQTEFDTLGETGGEKTHTLTINEMPSHYHDIAHTYLPNGSTSRWGINGIGTGGDIETSSDRGGDQPHNNLQPYIVVNYIIKY